MARLCVVLALVSLRWSYCQSTNQTSNATPSPLLPSPAAAAPVFSGGPSTTTPWFCGTQLCMGLVGAAAGTAGAAAIGGIVAATWPKIKKGIAAKKADTIPTSPKARHAIEKPNPSPSLRARKREETEGADWLIPVIAISLLILCCAGIFAYFLKTRSKKRSMKVKRSRSSKDVESTAAPETAPLNEGSEPVDANTEPVEANIFDNLANYNQPSMYMETPVPVFAPAVGAYAPGAYAPGAYEGGGVYATPEMVSRVFANSGFAPPGMYQQPGFY